MEKKESPKGERAVKPVISLPSEKWVLKIGFSPSGVGSQKLPHWEGVRRWSRDGKEWNPPSSHYGRVIRTGVGKSL